MADVASTLVPIAVLIGLGLTVRLTRFVEPATVDGIKKIIMDVCLPAVLFLAFLNIEFRLEYLWLILSVVGLLVVLFLLGFATRIVVRGASPVLPYVSTGFAFGFVGIPLFVIVFGTEHLGLFSVVGLGHEIFVWLIYYPILMLKFDRSQSAAARVQALLRSPLILSIFLALILNFAGTATWFADSAIGAGLSRSLELLADVTTPLILLVIGYGLTVHVKDLLGSFGIVAYRVILILTVGTLFRFLIVEQFILIDEPMVRHVFFTFLVLPPLFSLPIFLSHYEQSDSEAAANNVVALSTIVSLVLFVGYAILVQGGGI